MKNVSNKIKVYSEVQPSQVKSKQNVKLSSSGQTVNKTVVPVLFATHSENKKENTNKLIEINSHSSLDEIKGGELGFTYDPGAKGGLTHKAITFGQVASSFFRGADKEDVYIAHAFIVVGKKDDHTLIVAEAAGDGMKERDVDIRALEGKEQFRFYQNSDENFRKSLAANALKAVERKPEYSPEFIQTKEDFDKYLEDLDKYNKSNGLYDRALCLRVINRTFAWGEKSEKRLIRAAADFLAGNPLLNKEGVRKSQICSSFAALTYQATKFLQAIDPQILEEIKNLNDRDVIIKILHQEFKALKDSVNLFVQDHICNIDSKTTPSALEHRARRMTLT